MRTDSLLLSDGTPGSSDTTAEQADFIQRRSLVYDDDRNVCNNGVL